LLSTHILADVERVCDRVGIINKGRMVLESGREELLERYALPAFEIETQDGFGEWLETLKASPLVDEVQVDGRLARVRVKDIHQAQGELLKLLAEQGALIRRFELTTPSLEDIFLKLTATVPSPRAAGE
jgi:ABC-2 type transport system ATP-binding protein